MQVSIGPCGLELVLEELHVTDSATTAGPPRHMQH
jgi:hypothetical protein